MISPPPVSAAQTNRATLPACFGPFCGTGTPAFKAFPRFSDRPIQTSKGDSADKLTALLSPPELLDAFAPPKFQPVWATGLLSGGFLGGLGTVGLLKSAPKGRGIAPLTTNIPTKATAETLKNLQYKTSFIYGNAAEGLTSMLQLAATHAQFHKPLLAYLGASVLGYLTATMAQGVQEATIRHQETRIRGHLINRLKQAFGESIRRKQTMDDRLRETARTTIAQMLVQEHISVNPELSVLLGQNGGGNFTPSTRRADQQFIYGPVDRREATPTFGAGEDFGRAEPLERSQDKRLTRWLAAGALATGLALGGLTHTLFKALLKTAPAAQAGEVSNQITVYAYNTEAAFLSKNKTLLGGLFLVTALAKTGKLLVDALREIEVTRQNAETEYRYQSQNWTRIDPDFHWIAESAAMQQELKQFANDLPLLKLHPDQLAPRVQSILNNRGRSSPPPYYLSTPAVMLTEAKG